MLSDRRYQKRTRLEELLFYLVMPPRLDAESKNKYKGFVSDRNGMGKQKAPKKPGFDDHMQRFAMEYLRTL